VASANRSPRFYWLNPFWGPVADNGRSFEQMNDYEAIKKRIETVMSLPAFTDELFPRRQLGHSWLSMFSRFSIEAMSSVFPIAALKEKALLAF
jgi:hypothetical protein